jgi:ubiquinone/menaquinone biosynthesis C-methylase UbiE
LKEEPRRMNHAGKKHRLWKCFLDARWNWNFIQGPVYNRLISKAASDVYCYLRNEILPPRNTRILDVGSGPGILTLQLAKENPTTTIIGIDYSPTQVRAANRLKIRHQIQNCTFRKGDAMNLPFKDAHFDIVMSMGSIKHWPNAARGLQEIRRVLVPEGLAFIAESDRDASYEDFSRFACKFTAWYVWDRFMRWYLCFIVFGQSYTCEEAESLAKSAGFSQVEVKKVKGWPFFLMKLIN